MQLKTLCKRACSRTPSWPDPVCGLGDSKPLDKLDACWLARAHSRCKGASSCMHACALAHLRGQAQAGGVGLQPGDDGLEHVQLAGHAQVVAAQHRHQRLARQPRQRLLRRRLIRRMPGWSELSLFTSLGFLR